MNLTQALDVLKSKGYKYTGKREDILRYFTSENGYRTAKDLLEYMKKTYSSISFDTIYRNLYLFQELDLVEVTELDGEKHFRIMCNSTEHHHHFICLDCGNTEEVKGCPMKEVEQQLPGFSIENHKFEIYGKCPTCKSA
ncbi:Fur family transcriptional regulator [Pontibacillus halophilus JSM 076056 = DSM 19796]|uniref:Fur family transcriptional regulator n=1 Tax=Pontibacillus halophilus JSM 076056 = DSM 19796 TaxID=1385510 RepID=A0A0A5GLF9_9BACI|nr:Fur family transcriptional regulator [Pontibacillus halophilus]KGX92844.1 Fur family transcriptional regulator [Pontibacillus halophilus JSM 076056 = DSM 19796]